MKAEIILFDNKRWMTKKLEAVGNGTPPAISDSWRGPELLNIRWSVENITDDSSGPKQPRSALSLELTYEEARVLRRMLNATKL